jgi:hypothetical protein
MTMDLPVPVPLSVLTTPSSPEDELEELLAIATAVQLPTTSWVEGDITLSILESIAKRVSDLTQITAPMAAGGFLDFARTGWLTILAKQVFGEDRIGSTFASTGVTLTNTSSQTYVIAANDLTFEDSTTDKTYKNSDPSVGTVSLAPSSTLVLTVVADEAGAASSAGAGEIDTLVSTLLGVTVSNATAAVGIDEETDEALISRCKLKVPAISTTAAAPPGKYAYVAVTPSQNGGALVNRADVRGDQTNGAVTVVLAGPSGAVSGSDRTLVENALIMKVIGPVETLTVISATNATQTITYDLWAYTDINLTDVEILAQVSTRLGVLMSVAPIGGWKKTGDPNGHVFKNLIISVIRGVSPRIFEVEVSVPVGDNIIGANEVPVLGTVIGVVHFETPPATGGTV